MDAGSILLVEKEKFLPRTPESDIIPSYGDSSSELFPMCKNRQVALLPKG